MAPSAKPRDRSGYSSAETEQVKSVCLTVAATLGAMMGELCVVGGLVPSLLIDQQISPAQDADDVHPGTNDLDVGLAIGLLDDEQYAEISHRLRQEGFAPDHNENGNPTPQRWKLADFSVTVDFLMPPIPGAATGGRIHKLEGDFGALIATRRRTPSPSGTRSGSSQTTSPLQPTMDHGAPQHSKEAEQNFSTRQQPTLTATSTTSYANAAHEDSTSERKFREPRVALRSERICTPAAAMTPSGQESLGGMACIRREIGALPPT